MPLEPVKFVDSSGAQVVPGLVKWSTIFMMIRALSPREKNVAPDIIPP